MERYANRSGDSGVSTYEIGGNYIRVGFYKGGIYEYTYASAGSNNIEAMKSYATADKDYAALYRGMLNIDTIERLGSAK